MTITAATSRRKERPEPAVRTAERRRADGKLLGTVELEPSVFGLEPNVAVMHQVVTAQLAAARSGTQSTKTRAEVSGGGAKPFRQKGTGRARQGSTRSPQWTGGGIALGPKPRSYRQRTPKKMIRLALNSALSDRARLGQVLLVDRWDFEEPKTRTAVKALAALGASGKVLVVAGDEDLAAELSFRNLPHVRTLPASDLNTYDVLRSDYVVFTDDTLPGGVERFTPAPDTGEDEEAEEQASAATTEPAAAAHEATDDTAADEDDDEEDDDEIADVAAEDEIAAEDEADDDEDEDEDDEEGEA